MTPPTLQIHFKNTTNAPLFASVTGRDFDNGNRWFLLQADGRSAYHPTDPPQIGSPLSADCAISIGGPGSERTVTIPHLAGGRIYFAINEPLVFLLNPGPALVEPSVTNPSDPNYTKNWGFCEFTFNQDQLYANISYVDFVGVPVGIQLENLNGERKAVLGMPSDGIERVSAGLRAQSQADGQGWSRLVVPDGDGKVLRILSPNQSCVMDPHLFMGYYEAYVDEVWDRFRSQDLIIDTMAAGIVRGRVQGDELVFGAERFAKPSTRDIFSASSGPFQTGPSATRNAIIPRLNAEFHRSTYSRSDVFPAQPEQYYQHPITNHYARLVHAANADGRGYAHPYDDAAPAHGRDQSGFVNDSNPRVFSVIVGGGLAAHGR